MIYFLNTDFRNTINFLSKISNEQQFSRHRNHEQNCFSRKGSSHLRKIALILPFKTTGYSTSESQAEIDFTKLPSSSSAKWVWLMARYSGHSQKFRRKTHMKIRIPDLGIILLKIDMAWRAACQANSAEDFLKQNKLIGVILRNATQMRLHLLRVLKTKHKNWKFCCLDSSKPGYHVNIMKALAAGRHLRVAKRQSRSSPHEYETVRHDA